MGSRASYSPSLPVASLKSQVSFVHPHSPAHRAHIKQGDLILAVNGEPITDVIDWLWRTNSDAIEVTFSHGGQEKTRFLKRKPDQMWGIEFEEAVFDHVHLCKNGCTFCFVNMLPAKDANCFRGALYVKDDDYRLSFLQGNFVTLTNVSDEDLQRIIDFRLEPLHVSLHAVNAQVRKTLIGKHAARGIEVLDALLDSQMTVHAQIVLLPGVNDGEILKETLDWIEARPGILTVGIVPLGYTKYQSRFERTFSQEEAAQILDMLSPYQERALEETGNVRFTPSDEFYLLSKRPLPEAGFYEDFPQLEDGIGLLRLEADAWEDFFCEHPSAPRVATVQAIYLAGTAYASFMNERISAAGYEGFIQILGIHNKSFGGNVNVTGLLCASDIEPTLAQLSHEGFSNPVFLPRVMFNDDELTLDSVSFETLKNRYALDLRILPCTPESFTDSLREFL